MASLAAWRLVPLRLLETYCGSVILTARKCYINLS